MCQSKLKNLCTAYSTYIGLLTYTRFVKIEQVKIMKEETNEFLNIEYVGGQYDAVIKWEDYSQGDIQPLLWIKPRPQITGFVIPMYPGFMLECANSGKYLKSDKSYKGSIVGMYLCSNVYASRYFIRNNSKNVAF